MRDIGAAINQTSMELENTTTLEQQNEQQMRQWQGQLQVAAESLQRAREQQDDIGNQISRGFSVRRYAPLDLPRLFRRLVYTNLQHLGLRFLFHRRSRRRR